MPCEHANLSTAMDAASSTGQLLSHRFLFAHLLGAGDGCDEPPPAAPGGHAPLATALVLANTPARVPDFLRAVWAAASCVVVADGAANRLLAALGGARGDAAAYLPDLICGDLDSLTAPTRAFYEGLGVRVELDPDQDTTDLQKCLGRLVKQQAERGMRYRVVILGAFGGRLDQEAQNLHALYDPGYRAAFEHMCLLSEDCVASLLPAGTTRIAPVYPFEGPTVGLLPLGQPVAALTTAGLQWDVADWPCAFGYRMSTSNHVLAHDEWLGSSRGLRWLAWLRGEDGESEGRRHARTTLPPDVMAAALCELEGRRVLTPAAAGAGVAVAAVAAAPGAVDVSSASTPPSIGTTTSGVAPLVTVTSSHPILWTATIHPACVAAAWHATRDASRQSS